MYRLKSVLRAYMRVDAKRKALVSIALALLIILTVALCISISMRADIQRQYTTARNCSGEALYSNLYILMQTFDMTYVPNTDVQNVILPQMHDYYVASTTLNSLLSTTYGPKYAVLTESDIRDLDNAFSAYNAACASDSPTDLAQSNMQLCMERIKSLLNTRYSQGVLKPTR